MLGGGKSGGGKECSREGTFSEFHHESVCLLLSLDEF